MENTFKQLDEKFSDISEYSPKKLRTLRNNLNNRIAHFNNKGDSSQELKPSHRLYGLGEGECSELLKRVRKVLSDSSNS
jgi:glucuronate isomerase